MLLKTIYRCSLSMCFFLLLQILYLNLYRLRECVSYMFFFCFGILFDKGNGGIVAKVECISRIIHKLFVFGINKIEYWFSVAIEN